MARAETVRSCAVSPSTRSARARSRSARPANPLRVSANESSAAACHPSCASESAPRASPAAKCNSPAVTSGSVNDDSVAGDSRYSALIGEDYTETETYTTTNAQGKTETRTRTVTRTEHRPLHGEHAAYVADVLVTASRALGNAELEAVEPFDLRAIRRYDPSLVVGWIAEDPSMTAAECYELARREAVEKVGASLHGFMPGDSHRDLVHQTWLEQESLDLVLVPVWVLALRYREDRGLLRVLVNGQTGRVAGAVPWSRLRIALAVAAALLVVAAVVAAVILLEPA